MIFWQEMRNLGAGGGGSGTALAKPLLPVPKVPEEEHSVHHVVGTQGPRGRDQLSQVSPRCAPYLFCGEKRYRAQGSRLRQHSGL